MARTLPRPKPATVPIRRAREADLAALTELEGRVFATDRLTRRGFRRMLASPSTTLLVAEQEDMLAGYALVLFRAGSGIARLYSLLVDPRAAGRGIGSALLAAAEEEAIARSAAMMRLEVNVRNRRAIRLYEAAGYRVFGRHEDYYEDGAPALRYEKRLVPAAAGLRRPPPYVHQTSEFTCGPACVMMALAWADRSFRPDPAIEFQIWREATTVFMAAGHGGCDPYGLAVALKRRRLSPDIYVNRPGPYFLDTVQSEERRRVMRLTQEEFRREAERLSIPTHRSALRESVLMEAFDRGGAAIVLVAGYHMIRRRVPHWVFAFGREKRHVLLHDPAALRDARGSALDPATYAVPWSQFERMLSVGPDALHAAVLIRKGLPA